MSKKTPPLQESEAEQILFNALGASEIVPPKKNIVTARNPDNPVRALRVGKHPEGGWCVYEYTIQNGQITESWLSIDDDRATALHNFKIRSGQLFFEDPPEE